MSHQTYSPYGAYELKASYHRNLFIGNLYVFGTVLVGLAIYFTVLFFQPDIPKVIIKDIPKRTIIKDMPPLPKIIPENKPTVKPRPPKKPDVTRSSNIVPVDDTLIIEDEKEIISATDPTDISGVGDSVDGDYPFETDGGNEGIYDGTYGEVAEPGVFVPYEKAPAMIHKEIPEYPRLCRRIGLEGTVHLHVLVDIDGSVREVRVDRSSVNQSFDDAASQAAYKNKYSPAIQNGNPIPLWVGYKVDFKLEQ